MADFLKNDPTSALLSTSAVPRSRDARWVGAKPGSYRTLYVVNRVYDSSISKFVEWRTLTPDTTGGSYPGPGTWGVHTSGYVVAGSVTE